MISDDAVSLAHTIDAQARAAAALLNATGPLAGSISVHIVGQGSPIHIDLAALGQEPIPLQELSANIIHALVLNVARLQDLLTLEPWITAEAPP